MLLPGKYAPKTSENSIANKYDVRSNLRSYTRPVEKERYVIQYNREMHEQVAKMEEMRKGQPMPITLIKEDEGKEQMETHTGNQREDRQEFIPYILPDAIILEKNIQ